MRADVSEFHVCPVLVQVSKEEHHFYYLNFNNETSCFLCVLILQSFIMRCDLRFL